jgi:nucleoside-diphosphate kinase
MSQRTLVLLKPDAVRRGLVGNILSRFEAKGLSIVAMELRTIDAAKADEHYAEHVEKDFYPPLRDFVTSGPLVAAVLEGDEAIDVVRAINGATDGRKAAPGTIRGDLSLSNRENLVHGSDSAESAEREIKIWFPDLGASPARRVDPAPVAAALARLKWAITARSRQENLSLSPTLQLRVLCAVTRTGVSVSSVFNLACRYRPILGQGRTALPNSPFGWLVQGRPESVLLATSVGLSSTCRGTSWEGRGSVQAPTRHTHQG